MDITSRISNLIHRNTEMDSEPRITHRSIIMNSQQMNIPVYPQRPRRRQGTARRHYFENEEYRFTNEVSSRLQATVLRQLRESKAQGMGIICRDNVDLFGQSTIPSVLSQRLRERPARRERIRNNRLSANSIEFMEARQAGLEFQARIRAMRARGQAPALTESQLPTRRRRERWFNIYLGGTATPPRQSTVLTTPTRRRQERAAYPTISPPQNPPTYSIAMCSGDLPASPSASLPPYSSRLPNSQEQPAYENDQENVIPEEWSVRDEDEARRERRLRREAYWVRQMEWIRRPEVGVRRASRRVGQGRWERR
jgi:hypothetical protein